MSRMRADTQSHRISSFAICLPSSPDTHSPACIAHLYIHIHSDIAHSCLDTFLHAYRMTRQETHGHICTRASLQACLNTYMHACMNSTGSVYLSIYRDICLPIHRSRDLTNELYVYLPISIEQFVHLSVYRSAYCTDEQLTSGTGPSYLSINVYLSVYFSFYLLPHAFAQRHILVRTSDEISVSHASALYLLPLHVRAPKVGKRITQSANLTTFKTRGPSTGDV